MGTSVYEQYQRATAAAPPSAEGDSLYAQYQNEQRHKDFASGKLGREVANANDQDTAGVLSTPQAAGKAIGEALETPLAGTSGGRLLMSGARKLTNPDQPFADIQRDVNRETSDVPYMSALGRGVGALAETGGLTKLAGTGIVKAAPKLARVLATPAGQGAVMGGADEALNNDPDSGAGNRAWRTVAGGVVGGVTGKVLETAQTGLRALTGPSLGEAAIARRNATKTADLTNYGAAESEAAANGVHPDVTAALKEPDIAPYADVIRNSRKFQGADDNTILREAHKLMSERQGTLKNRVLNTDDFKAGTSLENEDLDLAKERMLSAADQNNPKLRVANDAHRQAMLERGALREGADATKRLVKGAQPAGKNLEAKTPEGFLASLPQKNDPELDAALEGVLGSVKQNIGPKASVRQVLGVIPSLKAPAQASRFVRAIDALKGGAAPITNTPTVLPALTDPANARSGLMAALQALGNR